MIFELESVRLDGVSQHIFIFIVIELEKVFSSSSSVEFSSVFNIFFQMLGLALYS